MRYHDVLALAGLCGLCIGVFLVLTKADLRLIGGLLALGSLGLLAYGASYL